MECPGYHCTVLHSRQVWLIRRRSTLPTFLLSYVGCHQSVGVRSIGYPGWGPGSLTFLLSVTAPPIFFSWRGIGEGNMGLMSLSRLHIEKKKKKAKRCVRSCRAGVGPGVSCRPAGSVSSQHEELRDCPVSESRLLRFLTLGPSVDCFVSLHWLLHL